MATHNRPYLTLHYRANLCKTNWERMKEGDRKCNISLITIVEHGTRYGLAHWSFCETVFVFLFKSRPIIQAIKKLIKKV